MRADQARQIPINRVCEWLGLRQSHIRGLDTWFFSPWVSDQETASFKTNSEKNAWIDFSQAGQGGSQYRGGSSIDLWLDLNGHDRRDPKAFKMALEALSSLEGYRTIPAPLLTQPEAVKTVIASKSQTDRYKLNKKPGRIWMDSLKQHLEYRGILQAVALPYLKQAYYSDTETGKNYNGFAFENDRNGWEISVPQLGGKTYKTVIGHKAPTTLTGMIGDKSAAIFEGFWDFLTWQQMNNTTALAFDRVYVLNSVTTINPVITDLKKNSDAITHVFLFTDNDDAGQRCSLQIFDQLEGSGTVPLAQNHRYADFKDLSDWFMANKTFRISNAPKSVKMWNSSSEANPHVDTIPKFPKY